MIKSKQRLLKELYDVTDIIEEPEMTPVLKGSYRIQGPMDEKKSRSKKNTGSSQTEKGSGRRSVKGKDGIKAESGTCNVCAAPCSSCMHFKRAGSSRGINSGNKLSNELSREKDASQCSLNDFKRPSLKNRGCKDRHSTDNETSNLVSPSSSHDSFSGKAESKASVDRSKDAVGGAVGRDEPNSKQYSGTGESRNTSLSRVASNVGQRTLSNRYEEQKVVACGGDNISCISGANGANTPLGFLNEDLDRDNILCSTDSANSVFPEAPGFCSENIRKISRSSRTNMIDKESTLKDHTISSENAVEVETGDPSAKSMKCLDLTGQVEKSGGPPEVPKTQDPPLDSQFVDDNDGLEVMEDDVKVCDICGDAGVEDLLAICSRCTDGAEHTYCMRKKMKKLPGKDWLCEECKLKGDAQKQKQDKFGKVGYSKVSSLNEKSENSGLAVNAKSNTKLPHGEENRSTKVFPSSNVMSKRNSDNLEVPPRARVPSPDEKGENSGAVVNSKIAPKSNANLLRGEENRASKATPSPDVSSKRHSDNLELAPSAKRQAVESSLGSPKPSSPSKKGTLLRESSFKNPDKEKLKPIHPISSPRGFSGNNSHDIAHAPTISAQSSSGVQKLIQSPRGTLLKSSSFSSTSNPRRKVQPIQDVPPKHNLVRNPSASEAKKDSLLKSLKKSLSFRPGNAQSISTEPKDKLPSSNLSHGEHLSGSKDREWNTVERTSSFRSDRISPMAMADQKAVPRGETTSALSSATRDLKEVQPDGRIDITSKLTSLPSQKGAEAPKALGRPDLKRQPSVLSRGAGQMSLNGSMEERKATQVSSKDVAAGNSYSIANSPLGGNNPDAVQQLPQSREYNQDKKAREPSFNQPKPSMLSGGKSIRCQKCKEIGHATQICPNVGLVSIEASAERSSREVMDRNTASEDATYNKSRLHNQSDVMFLSRTGLSSAKDKVSDGVHYGQEMLKDSSRMTDPDVKEAAHVLKRDLNEIVPSDESSLKSSGSDLPDVASSIPTLGPSIPELAFIWKGCFEVQKSGSLVDFYDEIHAHLSNCASPRVPEAVSKFPHKVLLKEVSRSSAWPTQFQNKVTEENIALYFFNISNERYTKSYNTLVNNMVANDLALIGNIDGIELLIFPSNHISVDFKSWNMLHFLWGVFRVRRMSCSDRISGPMRKLTGTDLNVVPLEENSGTSVMVVSQRECSFRNLDEDHSKFRSFLKREENTPTSSMQAGASLNAEEAGVARSTVGQKIQEGLEDSIGSDLRNLEEEKDKELTLNAEIPLKDDLLRSDKEQFTSAVQSSQKRSSSASVDNISQASAEASADTSRLVPWDVRASSMLLDGEEDKRKKMKRSYSDIYRIDSSKDHTSLTEGSLSQIHEQRLRGAYDDTVLPGSSRTSERHFFPMDLLGSQKHSKPRANYIPVQILSSDDEDQQELEVPNLELALGAEKKKSNQGGMPVSLGADKKTSDEEVLPLFTVLADEKNKHGKLPDTTADNSDDDLSLSLSVPFSDKSKMKKPVSSPPQSSPVDSHANTSLFFRGGFSGS